MLGILAPGEGMWYFAVDVGEFLVDAGFHRGLAPDSKEYACQQDPKISTDTA